MNLANQLTVLRIVLALATFGALTLRSPRAHLAAFALFLAAILTDWIDGYVARKMQTISPFGKVADPIADKILVIGTLIALTRDALGVPPWTVFLIIARELLIGGMRILTTAQGKVPMAEKWGKVKMGVQSVSVLLMIGILVVRDRLAETPEWLLRAPYWLAILCVVSAWQSAYVYFRQSQRVLEKSWE
jgi:CDP-diacylglycerol---glycerol-3-phosphate 3-phosphatidyltransferase